MRPLVGRPDVARHTAVALFSAAAEPHVAAFNDHHEPDMDPWMCYAMSERDATELFEMLRQLTERGDVP